MREGGGSRSAVFSRQSMRMRLQVTKEKGLNLRIGFLPTIAIV